MATVASTRANPAIRAFYRRLVDAGKPSKVALTACMRKLLVFCNALCQHQTTWDPTMNPCRPSGLPISARPNLPLPSETPCGG